MKAIHNHYIVQLTKKMEWSIYTAEHYKWNKIQLKILLQLDINANQIK